MTMSTMPTMIASGMRLPGTNTASPMSAARNATRKRVARPGVISTVDSSSGSRTIASLGVWSRGLAQALDGGGGTLTRHAVCFQNVRDLPNVPRTCLQGFGSHPGDRPPRYAAVEERGDGDLVGPAQHRGGGAAG